MAALVTSKTMSIEIHIFLEDSRVPNREAWQQAIEAAGFPAILDATLDLRKDTGFIPVAYNGQASGFELYLDSGELPRKLSPPRGASRWSRQVCFVSMRR